jgi:hypothetical protein
MIELIPARLDRALRQTLAPGERVFVQLKGAFTEALVCTDFRVLILKGGWMTGHMRLHYGAAGGQSTALLKRERRRCRAGAAGKTEGFRRVGRLSRRLCLTRCSSFPRIQQCRAGCV